MSSEVKETLSVKEVDDIRRLGVQGTNGENTIWVANGTENVSITNVAPTSVGTATISKWLKIKVGNTYYYIPMWT